MRAAILIATLLVCVGGPMQAQSDRRPNTRQGFWIGAGLGGGSAGSDCASCDNRRFVGLSSSVRLGGTLCRSVLVGGEVDGWLNAANTIGTETITVGSLVVLWYPSGTGALYLRFGLGGMIHYLDLSGRSTYTFTAPSASLGLGYEVRVAPRFSLCPYAKALMGSTGRLHDGVESLDLGASAPGHITITFVQAGLGLTWH